MNLSNKQLVDALANCITFELARGTEYFSISGKPLTTPQEVLRTIADNNGMYIRPVALNPSNGRGGEKRGRRPVRAATDGRSAGGHTFRILSLWIRGGKALQN